MNEKKSFSGILKCEHCSNSAPMEIVAEYSQIREIHDRKEDYSWSEGDVYQLLCCPACSKVNLGNYYYHEAFDEPEYIKYEILYPKSKGV